MRKRIWHALLARAASTGARCLDPARAASTSARCLDPDGQERETIMTEAMRFLRAFELSEPPLPEMLVGGTNYWDAYRLRRDASTMQVSHAFISTACLL